VPEAHPAKAVLKERRLTIKGVAEEYGCNQLYLGRVLNRRDKPSPRLRQFLSTYLGLPEDELFLDDGELVLR
jgi:transcriptional regulator with XRE-family HTH domain